MELILYLEPIAKSFVDGVNDFITNTDNSCMTTAMKYHCHITMTGFFLVNDGHQLNAVIACLNRLLKCHNGRATVLDSHPAPTLDCTPMLIRKKSNLPQQLAATSSDQHRSTYDMPVHLLLPVSVPSVYHTIVNQFASEFTEIRPKAINHISLAYWDEPQATEAEAATWYRAVLEDHWMDRLYDLAKKKFKNCPLPKEWDIVLYERVQKSSKVGVPHVLVERRRWHAAPLRE